MNINLKAAVAIAGFALTGLAVGTGVAHADDVIVGSHGVPIPYTTEKACISDGPDTHLETNDQAYPYWYCQRDEDGSWYLHNTDKPNP